MYMQHLRSWFLVGSIFILIFLSLRKKFWKFHLTKNSCYRLINRVLKIAARSTFLGFREETFDLNSKKASTFIDLSRYYELCDAIIVSFIELH